MNTPKALVSQQGLSSIQRPRFSPGLLLEDEDLTAGVDYARDMMRLMFRSLFGCGVICGLDVTATLTCNRSRLVVKIDHGVALDCLGDPIFVPRPQTVTYDPECKEIPEWIWVTLCRVEKCCRPKEVSCADDEGRAVHTRVQEAFEIRLYGAQPDGACSCEPAAPPPATRDDGCADTGTRTPDANTPQGGGTADAPAVEAGVREEDACACYQDHYDGRCDCDSGCTCVVIGKIRTTGFVDPEAAKKDPHVDAEVLVEREGIVREIRPVLNGYLKCREAERKKAARASGESKPDGAHK